MNMTEWILEEANTAHLSGCLVTESNLLMDAYQEIKAENDLIRKQFINSTSNIKCKGEWKHG